jgi:MarR family transcriptional regulator, organic hydroperoxide resistance regulator
MSASSQRYALPDRPGRVLRQFRAVFNAVKTHFQQVRSLAGASGAQVWALHAISERPGIGVSELARTMDIRQPTASIVAKALAKQQLIEIRREGPDRRAVQLYATPEGKKVLRVAPGPFVGLLPHALAALNKKTLAQLESNLAELIRQLGVGDRGATTPLGGD